MTKITASDVNNLRKQTGAGMMDCKNALVEAGGDTQKAIDILRKKGQKIAAKRADRDTMEGAVLAGTTPDNTVGFIVSLNCETDFVAKNDSYVALAQSLLDLALANDPKTKEEFLALPIDGMTVAEKLVEQTGVIGEKLDVQYFERLASDFVGYYIHAGNKIASTVAFNKPTPNAADLAKDVAMQVAAMNPVALNKDAVDAPTIERELEIAKELARKEGKPEDMLEKIAQGRLNKFFKESTLVDQAFIKDNKLSVSKYLKSSDKDLEVVGFRRCSLT